MSGKFTLADNFSNDIYVTDSKGNPSKVKEMWLTNASGVPTQVFPNYGKPIITSVTCGDIPAKGGSISSCVVKYTQVGVDGEQTTQVSFDSVTADSLYDKVTTSKTSIATRKFAITFHDETSDEYTLTIYQATNAAHGKERTDYTMTWTPSGSITAAGGSVSYVISAYHTGYHYYDSGYNTDGSVTSGKYTGSAINYTVNDAFSITTSSASRFSTSGDATGTGSGIFTVSHSDMTTNEATDSITIYFYDTTKSTTTAVGTATLSATNALVKNVYNAPTFTLGSISNIAPNGTSKSSAPAVSNVKQTYYKTYTSGYDASKTTYDAGEVSYTAYYSKDNSSWSTDSSVVCFTSTDMGTEYTTTSKTIGTAYVKIVANGATSAVQSKVAAQSANTRTTKNNGDYAMSISASGSITAAGGEVSYSVNAYHTEYYAYASGHNSSSFTVYDPFRVTCNGSGRFTPDSELNRTTGSSSAATYKVSHSSMKDSVTTDSCTVYFYHSAKSTTTAYTTKTLSATNSSTVVYLAPTFTLGSISNIAPNGTSKSSAPSVSSLNQQYYYGYTSGYDASGTKYNVDGTSWATIYYSKDNSTWSTDSSAVCFTSTDKGTTASDAVKLGTAYVKVYSYNGKLYSSTQSKDAYQSANAITSYGTVSVTIKQKANISAGAMTLSTSNAGTYFSYSASQTITYTSGSTRAGSISWSAWSGSSTSFSSLGTTAKDASSVSINALSITATGEGSKTGTGSTGTTATRSANAITSYGTISSLSFTQKADFPAGGVTLSTSNAGTYFTPSASQTITYTSGGTRAGSVSYSWTAGSSTTVSSLGTTDKVRSTITINALTCTATGEGSKTNTGKTGTSYYQAANTHTDSADVTTGYTGTISSTDTIPNTGKTIYVYVKRQHGVNRTWTSGSKSWVASSDETITTAGVVKYSLGGASYESMTYQSTAGGYEYTVPEQSAGAAARKLNVYWYINSNYGNSSDPWSLTQAAGATPDVTCTLDESSKSVSVVSTYTSSVGVYLRLYKTSDDYYMKTSNYSSCDSATVAAKGSATLSYSRYYPSSGNVLVVMVTYGSTTTYKEVKFY